MSKTYKVESTRKNPDRLIAQLKNSLEWERKWRAADYKYRNTEREEYAKEIERLKGKLWATLATGTSHTIRCVTPLAEKIHLNQSLLIKGTVIGYKRLNTVTQPNEITISLTKVMLKEEG